MVESLPGDRSFTSRMLDFVKKNVLNITDITRTTKLTEILDSYANRKSEEVYIVQNNRNKDAQAVIIDMDFFQELVFYRDAIDNTIDSYMYQVMLERKDDVADIDAATVIDKHELDLDRIMARAMKELERGE